MYYLNNFFLYAIFGHLFETIFFVTFKIRKKSGFLYLWWTPFYGLGVLITMAIYKIVNKYVENKYWKNCILFVAFFLILSLLEFLGGIFLEKLYGYAFWDYTNIPLNIGKYVSLGTSLVWTIFSFLYIYCFKKYSDKLIKKIPKFLTVFLSIVFIIDCIASIGKIFT